MSGSYKIEAPLHRGARSRVCRATRVASGAHVVLKTSAVDGASPDALTRSQREYSVAAGIHSEHVVAYLGVERFDHSVAIVQEAFGDLSLAELLAKRRLSTEGALHIGAQMASALVDIHAHDVTHRAIHPGNVVVENATLSVKVIDFAEASVIGQSCETTETLDARVIPLSYMSPEQTGRMNRTVDYRTDFYSLGATLYHMLAGRAPFDFADPLAMVHAQLALSPVPLSERDPRIPGQVARVVDKLLAKGAEDRYQSAGGVLADLAECLVQLQVRGTVERFPLGREDVCERFQIPERLYGRAAVRARLNDAFGAARGGAKLLFLIRGYSGVGKSSLVREAAKHLGSDASFVWGKFEQLQQQRPYSALGQALGQLCRTLLSLPEKELSEWKRRILERIPTNAGLISDFVPDLARIVGAQPPVPETGLIEAQHRFDLTLTRLLSVFASRGRPLMIFLDDLQWADPASLHAITALLRLPEPTHVLLVGAYRDNEVDASHPLTQVLSDLGDSAVELRSVQLTGLSKDDVAALVADTVHSSRAEVAGLAELIVEKTSGNPFFIDELLRMLFSEKLIWFCTERRRFRWDLAAIGARDVTANVVELMVRKLEHLPPATQDSLRLGACVGGRFDLELLAAAADLTSDAVRARLAPAIRERLVVPLDPHYPLGLVDVSDDLVPNRVNYRFRFLHDGVQHAVYSSIPTASLPAQHLRLGRILLARRGADGGESIFEIAGQLGRGIALVTEPAERLAIAELNLLAGRRARGSTAYHEGLEYFRRGIVLLPPDGWSEHYTLALALHLGCLECAYLAGLFDEAERSADALLPKIRTVVEQAELYAIRIVLEANRGHYAQAIDLGRSALAALGHPIPRFDSALPLLTMRCKVALAMAGRRVEDLAQQPELHDPTLIAVVKLVSELLAPAFLGDQKLFAWLVHDSIYLAIKNGTIAETAVGYVDYGVSLIAREQNYRRALAFGRLALARSERPDAFPLRSHIQFAFGACINACAEAPMSTSVAILQRAIDVGLESGDLLFASFASGLLPEFKFMIGEPLDRLIEDVEQRGRTISALRHGTMEIELRAFRQCLLCLRGETQSGASLTNEALDESTLVATVHAAPALLVRGIYFIFKIIVLTIFGEYKAAVQLILDSDAVIYAGNSATTRVAEYDFFSSLALVAGLRDGAFDPSPLRRLLRKKLRRLATCARCAPQNFRHTQRLVSAELADLKGQHSKATALYHEAIEDAATNGFPQHAALASELAGLALVRRGQWHVARCYLETARAGYQTWAALGKVRALDALHPELAHRSEASSQAPMAIDAVSVVRASQALSSEIAQPALLEKIMRVIVQASGSQRGVLLVEEAGELRVEGYLDAERNLHRVAASPALERARLVSEAIVRYTLRTGEDVVLSHAVASGAFTRDPYVVEHQSKSILCLTVRHRDKVTGVLFLENDLSTDVFTEQRLAVLRPLVAQAATSLENARLYEATRKLNVALERSEGLLREILQGMPVGVYVVDAQGQARFANRRAREILRQEINENAAHEPLATRFPVYRAGSDELYPPDRMPVARALRGETTMTEDIEFELSGADAGTKRVPIAVWGTPIRDEHDAVRYAIVAFQDITEQRTAAAARADLEAQLHQAQRLDSIGRLAGGVAHDFNNLLTPILAYSELAAEVLPDDSPVRAYAVQIRDAAVQAAELTRQLLAVGRKQALEPRALDLNRELQELEKMLRRVTRENIELELRLAPKLGRVRADAAQLQRVFINLALNAGDAMPDGGRLTVQTLDMPDSKALPSGPCVAFRVIDTGHGMSKATLARIFEPFFTTKEPGKGTGLGLATVHGIVAQHGGQLFVQSEPGQGTTFEVRLPRANESAQPVEAVDSEPTGTRKGHGEVILVVEDDPAVRRVIEDVLVREDYHVVATGEPLEALRLAHELGERLDLLVTDIVMPRLSGPQVLAEIRRERPELSALLVSGYAEQLTAAEATVPAGCALLRKPLAVDALRAHVGQLLERRAGMSRSGHGATRSGA